MGFDLFYSDPHFGHGLRPATIDQVRALADNYYREGR